MSRRKRILSLLCALALAVGLLLPGMAASADEVTVYQTSVNDKLLSLNAETMPAVVGGIYYVPYTVFSRELTGVNLGVSYGQVKTDTVHTLTIYSLGGLLSFDLNAGTCVDGNGNNKNMRAILRNGRVYVPLGGVCSFFGLKATYTPTPYGTLVRITNDQAVLSTERFVDAATSQMKQRYNTYISSLGSDSSSGGGNPSGSGSGSQENVRVYLAFRAGGGEGLDLVLDALDEYGVCALFCFRVEDLTACDEQIRRMVGSGHTVGLIAPEELEGAALTEYLAEGERLLSRIAHLRPHIVMAEGEEQTLTELEEQGWALWEPNVDGLPNGRSAAGLSGAILTAAAAKRSWAMITMDDSLTCAGALSRLLPGLRAAHYNIRLPVETEI